MNDQYDFSNAGRGAVACGKGKTRITIMLDEAVIEAARSLARGKRGLWLPDSDQQHASPRLAQ